MVFTLDLLFSTIFIFFTIILIFYYLFFFLRLAIHKAKSFEPSTEVKPVSIIICAFNEEANLKKNIANWLEQDYSVHGKPFFEVVVVNDNSEDDSFYFLNTMMVKYPHLHVVNLTQEAKLIPGKKFPLSMGIKSARYENLLLTDADCQPASNQWLKEMSRKWTPEKKIVLGYSPYFKQPGWLNKCIRFETVHSAIQYFSYALAKTPYMGVGRNLAYERSLFNQNKGFSSHHHLLSGDDDLFINQVANSRNTAIQINPNSFVYTEAKKTKEEWHYQKKRHLSTGKYYKTKHQLLLGIYAFSHFASWLSLIPAIIFYQYLPFTLIAFCLRWLVQWLIFQQIFSKLKENDLIHYIWLFDIWQLWYNIKSAPSIFFKQRIHWK